jgi:LmbE family N-acetylglucosaminyl deacetylase
MLRFLFSERDPARLRFLFLGAHSDDIEIGCGGAALRLLREFPGAAVRWVVLSAAGARAGEARASAAEFLAGAGERTVEVHAFEDAHFPSRLAEIKRCFEGLKGAEPTVVFTHARHDLHQDHRVVCELTWNTFRDHAILEYEVPKYDGDLGSPNLFVALDGDTARKKAALIRRHFASQAGKPWFDEEVFLGLMRLRGLECRAPGGYAEAFYARKVLV